MIASISGFLLLASDGIEGGFANGYMGTKGLLTAFLATFITVNIYKVCVKNNVTIRMPDEVPPNVSQAFKDVIPYALSIFVLYGIDLVTRQFLGTNVAEAILKLFEPLFTAKRWLCWYYHYLWCLCLVLVCRDSWSINC